MNDIEIRDATRADFAAICALNLAEVRHTSAMDVDRLMALHEKLFAFARAQQIPQITCEYNLVPANEPSRRFHEKLGFTEQGTQWLVEGTKKVSLQAARVHEE